jgi:hypothetical protein
MNKSKAIEKRAAALTVAGMWGSPEIEAKLKEMYGADLKPTEWMTFKALSKSANANPFRGEIYALVFGSEAKKNRKPAIFLGKNQFIKIAHDQPDYDHHRAQAVYKGDHFKMTEKGFEYNSCPIEERGEILGAFALAKRKGSSEANFKYVDFQKYYKSYSSTWNAIPATMIEKVALSQILKETWYEPYGGPGGTVYIDAEKEIIEATYEELSPEPDVPEPKKTNGSNMDFQQLEVMLLDKLLDIEKVKVYLKSKGLERIEDMNAMQYRIIFDEVAAM